MNRLLPSFDAASSDSLGFGGDVSSGVFRRDGDGRTVYFAPLHYEQGYAYPLVLWLHSGGLDEKQLHRVMPEVSLRNFVGAAVRGTLPNRSKNGRAGFTWSQSPAEIAAAEQHVCDAIGAACERYHVAPRRVFLAGHDCGGTMAFRLAMARPDRFAGVASIGGRFPDGGTPLAQLAAARRVPLLLIRGRASARYSSQAACNDLRLFHAAGMDVTLREYPGDDRLAPQMLGDLNRWIMEQLAVQTAVVD